jgi:hypothetical protein
MLDDETEKKYIKNFIWAYSDYETTQYLKAKLIKTKKKSIKSGPGLNCEVK